MKYLDDRWLADREDTFSLDETLSPIISAGLRKYLEVIRDPKEVAGCPHDILSEVHPGVDSPTDEQVNDGCTRWWSILEDILYAFESVEPCPVYHATADVEFLNAHTEWVERRNRGLALFAKHYNDLWW